MEELHSKLQPHLLRRMKRDVLGAMPPKKEQIVRVELAPPQRALYKATLTSQFDVLTAGGAPPPEHLHGADLQSWAHDPLCTTRTEICNDETCFTRIWTNLDFGKLPRSIPPLL